MKRFGSKLLVMCGLMVMLAGVLAPAIVKASCPTITVDCGDSHLKSCAGTSDGQGHCTYSESCLNCGDLLIE
jgi:hypothetical protein